MLPEKSRKMMTAVPGDVAAMPGDKNACIKRRIARVIGRWSTPTTFGLGSYGPRRSPGARLGDGARSSARHSMATATWLIVGSVDKAVTAGSHDGASPNRRRRSRSEEHTSELQSHS